MKKNNDSFLIFADSIDCGYHSGIHVNKILEVVSKVSTVYVLEEKLRKECKHQFFYLKVGCKGDM